MGKKSVFTFEIKDISQKNNILPIINNYLGMRGFHWDQERKFYINVSDTQDELKKGLTASIFSLGGLSGSALASTKAPKDAGIRGFECYFSNNNELIVKAFVMDYSKKYPNPIHSTMNNSAAGSIFLSDIKENLFNNLNQINVVLKTTTMEKIKDGSTVHTLKILAICLAPLFLFIIIAFIFMLTHSS